MAKSARRLVAPSPPADFAEIALTPDRHPLVTWYRIVDRRHRTALHWNRSGVYRFDSPDAPHGVCYAAESITAAFQEIWGDRIRQRAPVDWAEFVGRDVWRIDVPRATLLTLAGPTLTTLRATLQCFVGSYPLSQAWGRALMAHPANLDGVCYLGRRCGAYCVALFGDRSAPKPYQAAIVETRLGPLVQWKRFFPLRSQLRLRISSLPTERPAVSYDLP